MGGHGLLPGQFSTLAGLAIDKNNRVITSEQYPGRVQIFRYVTDAEAKLELAEREKVAAEKKAAPAAKASCAGKARNHDAQVSGRRVWLSARRPSKTPETGAFIEVIVCRGRSNSCYKSRRSLKTVMKKTMLVVLVVLVAARSRNGTEPGLHVRAPVSRALINWVLTRTADAAARAAMLRTAARSARAETPSPAQIVDTANAGNYACGARTLVRCMATSLTQGDNVQGGATYVTTLPHVGQFFAVPEEITGIMMCLSCHDGNIAKGAMMTNKSYEQAAGLLPAGLYGPNAIPTLLGNDGTTAGNYYNDHPVGPQATLGAVGVASNFLYTVNGCGSAASTTA